MMKIEFDFSDLEAAAVRIGANADQVPFALALALNRAADVTRNLLIKATWPQHVNARNSSFIAASLTTKEARANKTSLAVEIYDKLERGNLMMQAKGGTRTPQGGSNLAVPASNVKRTSRGVPQRLRPKNLPTAVRKGDVLYARDRKGRSQPACPPTPPDCYPPSVSCSTRTSKRPCIENWCGLSLWLLSVRWLQGDNRCRAICSVAFQQDQEEGASEGQRTAVSAARRIKAKG